MVGLRLGDMSRHLLVRATVNVVGLVPGERAEIEDTPLVQGMIRSGLLTLLRAPQRTEITFTVDSPEATVVTEPTPKRTRKTES